ncbi:MAG TPA: MFS transporter [Acidimicrobiia bacterium]|nr:MFS transporter [Acidimicrobiia bacterium]
MATRTLAGLMTSSVAPLQLRGFRSLWGASLFSNIGGFLQASAAAWLMLDLTGSATWVGLISASTTLPFLALALLAGAVADMRDRVRILLVSQIAMAIAAAAMAVLAFVGEATPVRLLVLGLLIGVAGSFNLPAWQALVPDLVPREMIASAVALNSVSFNVARAVGPALGGLLIATVGAEAGFGLNALSYLSVVIALWLIGRTGTQKPADVAPLTTAMALGWRFARYTHSFRRVLMFGALFGITSSVVPTVLPSHTEALGGGSLAYGVLLGTMGLGAVGSAFARRRLAESLKKWTVPAAIAGYSLGGIVIGLAPSLAWAVSGLVVSGASLVLATTTLNSTAQMLSPRWVRGRTMSLWSLAFAGMTPIGAILAGAVADTLTTRASYVLISLAGVGLAIASIRSGIPVLSEIVPPEFDPDRAAPEHVETLDSGPVMVLNGFDLDPGQVDEFLEAMQDLRLVRLRTGAYRWRLYRDAADPRRLIEMFLVVSWREHLNQHRRIDDVSAALIRRARAFDRTGEPRSRHLIAVDVEKPPDFDLLLATHAHMHETDGSILLEETAEFDAIRRDHI